MTLILLFQSMHWHDSRLFNFGVLQICQFVSSLFKSASIHPPVLLVRPAAGAGCASEGAAAVQQSRQRQRSRGPDVRCQSIHSRHALQTHQLHIRHTARVHHPQR